MLKKKFHIITYGCQMNVHDSERIAGILQAEGCTPAEGPDNADIIVFNTCSIRQKAEHKFMSQLGRFSSVKKKRPDLVVAVAGCVAEQEGIRLLSKTFPVDFVVGPQNIAVFREIARGDAAPLHIGENSSVPEAEIDALRGDKVKAWVTIMHGCDNFCSYCVVPFTRGRERSRDAQYILREISELSSRGIKEVCLLGQNVNSYNKGVTFPELLRAVNAIEGIERVRFVTSHPKDFSDELIAAIGRLPKVCEHVHLPLQSGSSRILELMNRKYTYDDYRKKVTRLRECVPNICITSDIIAGFPQEADDDFRATLTALEEIRFDGIFAFAFSPRPNTRAATMTGMVPEPLRYERLNRILALQDLITDEKNSLLQSTFQEVLIEGIEEGGEGRIQGRTRGNKKVVLTGQSSARPGDILEVCITKAKRHGLEGVVR